MQCRHLLVIIFGLLLVGAVAKNTSAYQGLGWNKYTKIQPLGTSKYVRTISTSQSYTLTVTVIKNW